MATGVPQCVICCEIVTAHRPGVILPCEETHEICYQCIRKVFDAALQNPQFKPPKCSMDCGYREILAEGDVSTVLSPPVVRQWQECKAKRAGSYCPNPSCKQLVVLTNIDHDTRTGKCPACNHQYCTLCKGPPGHTTCPKEAEDAGQPNDTVWSTERKRCGTCGAMNELTREERRHFYFKGKKYCDCGQGWCWTCSKTVATCQCPPYKRTH